MDTIMQNITKLLHESWEEVFAGLAFDIKVPYKDKTINQVVKLHKSKYVYHKEFGMRTQPVILDSGYVVYPRELIGTVEEEVEGLPNKTYFIYLLDDGSTGNWIRRKCIFIHQSDNHVHDNECGVSKLFK